MSLEIDLFISSDENLAQIVDDLQTITGIVPQQVDNNPYILFKFETEERYIDIGTHEYVNDQGINFEDYPYVVTFDVRSGAKYDQSLRQFVSLVFEELKRNGKYRLMLVEQLSRKLDYFDPKTLPQ